MKPKVNITSEHIKRLLAVKHAKDVLVTECKNGQSWASGTHQLLKAEIKRMRELNRTEAVMAL